ncbi:MAG: V-type ATP synthase subunit F [Bullifex sp.]
MEYYVIADEDVTLGFSLVGIQGVAVHSREEAEAAFDSVVEMKRFGIIIITEKAASFIREKVDKYLFTEDLPLVVEIPNPGEKSSRDLRTLVNEAIGVSI